jgi:hypothetical protein
MSPKKQSEPKERLGLTSLAWEADRKKQASGTRAPTEPEDVDSTSSPNIAKSGAHHSENDASKEVTTSKHAAVIQPGKPDLGFHPEMMDEGVSRLQGNVPKEENYALERRHCRPQLGWARFSSGDRRSPPPRE